VPFLDHRFTAYYLSLPAEMRAPKVSPDASQFSDLSFMSSVKCVSHISYGAWSEV